MGRCYSFNQIGGTFDVNSPLECRNLCFDHAYETYFVVFDNDTKCNCYHDCDVATRQVEEGSTIYEVISDQVGEELSNRDEELDVLRYDLDECKVEINKWKLRYEYVDSHTSNKVKPAVEVAMDNALEEVFNSAENNFKMESDVETEVGTMVNGVESSKFNFTATLLSYVFVLGLGVGIGHIMHYKKIWVEEE